MCFAFAVGWLKSKCLAYKREHAFGKNEEQKKAPRVDERRKKLGERKIIVWATKFFVATVGYFSLSKLYSICIPFIFLSV